MRSRILTKPTLPEIGTKTYDSFFCIIPKFLPINRRCIRGRWRWLETVYVTSECIGHTTESPYYCVVQYWSTPGEIAEYEQQQQQQQQQLEKKDK